MICGHFLLTFFSGFDMLIMLGGCMGCLVFYGLFPPAAMHSAEKEVTRD